MKYVIEVEEEIRKINIYTIEVNNENEAEEFLDSIECYINRCSHPDDVPEIIRQSGYEVLEYCEGAENCNYELL